MTEQKKTKVKVYKLGWDGMELRSIAVNDFDRKKLKVDNWFAPQIGELCFNSDGELDVVKNITFKRSDGVFKATNIYTFENSTNRVSQSMVIRVEVKRGKRFIFNGKIFVHQEPLCGSYIDKMARGEKIKTYAYPDDEK